MWMLPLYLHVNQKSDYDYDDMKCIGLIQMHREANLTLP